MISVFDLFQVGIGPSSSHTVGPMRAARHFALALDERGLLGTVTSVTVELCGSLGATGIGHATDRAVLLGLEGAAPDGIDPDEVADRVAAVHRTHRMRLLGRAEIALDPAEQVRFRADTSLPLHPNGLRLTAADREGAPIHEATYYSVGGGFVVDADGASLDEGVSTPVGQPPYPHASGAELLAWCEASGLPTSAVALANESTLRAEPEVRSGLLAIWAAMEACIDRGCAHPGVLPGGLGVPRRAPGTYAALAGTGDAGTRPGPGPGHGVEALDWVSLWALAVNEENAGGGRVVTAPTNGAAGIVPAVLRYYRRFVPGADDDGVVRFLLTAGLVGALCKSRASISGADVGCQGEVGSACAMAAAGLAEVLGGTACQVENAAEIAMEHNLGLTCDPVAGLVQVPCIERNAIGAVKAIAAARMALRGDGTHLVSFDAVLETMRATGADMHTKYKETALGGLAVSLPEC